MICINKRPPTEPTPQKKRWLSPSSINAYLRCPRKFYYSRIARLKQRPSIHLIRGIAIHSAIGKFYRHRINRCANMDYADLRSVVLDLLKDEWTRHQKGLNELKLKPDDLAFYYHESEKMILNFLHDFIMDHGFEKPEPVLEKALFSQRHMLFGRVDAIYDDHCPPLLIDYKTCKSKELSDEYRRQLGIYALLYEENFGTKPMLGIQFLRFQNELTRFRISDTYLNELRDLVAGIHTKTQSKNIDDYPCLCGWCERTFYTGRHK